MKMERPLIPGLVLLMGMSAQSQEQKLVERTVTICQYFHISVVVVYMHNNFPDAIIRMFS